MYIEEASTKRRRLIIGGTVFVLALLFVISFGHELLDFLSIFVGSPGGLTETRWESTVKLGYQLLEFLVFFGFWVVLVSQQALLPVATARERLRVAFQFLVFILGQHGQAVFVKDGRVLSTKADNRDGPGVAVVDFNSAIVLEERLPPPGIGSGFDSLMHRLMWTLGLADRAESPRVMGPGIVFMRPRERIKTAVDLRRQFRVVKEVTGYTRNGIEVSANVWSIFTIGQEPDVVQVSYDGEHRPENLRVLSFERLPDGHLRLISMSDELDRLDRQEIHHFFHVLEYTHAVKPYTPLPESSALPVFNRDRVFAAAYAEARGEDENPRPWTELPTRLAASIFREIISQVSYDDLYQPGSILPLPLNRYKARLRQTMRNNGLLSFRLVFLASGEPFSVRRVYREADLIVSEVRPLMNSKILRDRGIKVIASGFGDITPVSEAVYRHRLESWRAPWQRDAEIISAARELEASRIRARARALAQQDLVAHLKQIYQTTSHQEVLAVRLMQAFDRVASDPQTRQLLPGNTLDLMKHAHQLLSLGEINPPPPHHQPPDLPQGGGA